MNSFGSMNYIEVYFEYFKCESFGITLLLFTSNFIAFIEKVVFMISNIYFFVEICLVA